jgi:ketosteroid isomerase-like protein
MSQENVERVREGFEAFNEGGVPAMAEAFWASDVVWDMRPTGVPGLGTYEGAEGIGAFMDEWLSAFNASDWQIEASELIDAGDQVVAVIRQRGRGAASGADVELEAAQLITVREGKAARIVTYLTRAEALEAAGLSE